MNFQLEIYQLFCYPRVFIINKTKASVDDFGEFYDLMPDAETGCRDRTFIPFDPEEEVLKKYQITEDEYNYISGLLKEKLSFGQCNFCS